MSRNRFFPILVFTAGVTLGAWFMNTTKADAQHSGRIFELRTYTAPEGKLDALEARFRDHTAKLFEKHGMTNIGYWVPADSPQSKNTLIYILAHPSRDRAKKNWEEFRADPEWQKVQKESEANGKLVSNIVSVYMEPTDFSPVK
jgi:hypothetical protein